MSKSLNARRKHFSNSNNLSTKTNFSRDREARQRSSLSNLRKMAAPASIHSVSSASRFSASGVWEPLSSILYGFAIHPLTPSVTTKRLSHVLISPDYPNGLHTLREEPESESWEETTVNPHQATLEVGDEVYAFEKFMPDIKTGAIWYRGYVVRSTHRPTISLKSTDYTSFINGMPYASSSSGPAEDPDVTMGIFPASHIHTQDYLADAEGRLAEVYSRMINGQNEALRNHSGMETLREEDESPVDRDRKSDPLAARPKSPRGPRAARTISLGPPIISVDTQGLSPVSGETSALSSGIKPPPPRPSLKSGDETALGASQPLVDEISSALREWHSLLFKHLERRDYRLFEIVKEHIEALHLGRRQLLTQTLSAEETSHIRRECVARLVRGNVVQDLDVIVRHPTWGGLVTVDTDNTADMRCWLSAVRMYAMQASIPYVDNESAATGFLPKASALSHPESVHRLSTPILSAPSPSPVPMYSPSSTTDTPKSTVFDSLAKNGGTLPRPAASFFHVYVELRAFVASFCLPGETSELYFALYNKNTGQFLTEHFCAILNHNGVLARGAVGNAQPGHIRMIFRDLGDRDVQDEIYLICRIVRNGGMKLGDAFNSGGTNGQRRGSETSLYADITALGSSQNGRNSAILSRTTLLDGSSPAFRRPFGVAVLDLNVLRNFDSETGDSTASTEYTLPIFVPRSEASFATLHQDIIASSTKGFETSAKAQSIAVVVKAFHGEAETIIRENPSLLQDIPVTSRLGFPDVVFPGDVRNEIYIKLWSGEFFSNLGGGGRIRSMASFSNNSAAPTNVQVTVEVRTRAGALVEGVISQGSGEPPVTQWNSMVFYRNNSPTFDELIKLQISPDLMQQCHLFFTFRHRNSKERPSIRTSQEVLADKPFAFAYLPLVPDGRAFVSDGSHTLVLYRADKSSWSSAEDYYSAPPTLPAGHRMETLAVPLNVAKTAIPIRDSLVIRSLLCSTQFTQNSVLLGLLSWDSLTDKQNELRDVLSKFTFVGEVEIVKFLRDIFDSLFAILVSSTNENNELDDLVFNALVLVLGIIQDRRFKNFQPVLDVYIEKHFSCAAASFHIIHSLNRLLEDPAASGTASQLRNAFKVWHYLFKFIIRARELQKSREVGMGATSEHLETAFKRELSGHLSNVNELMNIPSPSANIGTQTIAVQQFSSILPDLHQVFTPLEVVDIATDFANTLSPAKGRMVIWKLIMYLQLVQGFLFDNAESRSVLLESMVGWIKPHLGRYDEFRHTHLDDLEPAKDAARVGWLETLRLSLSIIAVMLDKMQQVLVDPEVVKDRKAHRLEEANVEFLLSLLPRVLESYQEFHSPETLKALERNRSPATTASPFPISFPSSYPFSLIAKSSTTSKTVINGVLHETVSYHNCGLGEAAVAFLVMILASTRKDIINFLNLTLEIEGRSNLSRLLVSLFAVSSSILQNDAFPTKWLNINVLAHKVLLKLAEPVAIVMIKEFISDDPTEKAPIESDRDLWFDFLRMLLKLLSSDQLVIEEFSPQKRRAVWRLAGDVRGEGASLLLKCWDALGWPEPPVPEGVRVGGYQASLIDLVDHVLSLCLSHHDQLRTNAVHILFTMIVLDYQRSGDFLKIETELINKLDELFVSESKADDVSRAFFINQLRTLFDASNVDDQLRARVSEFLDSVDLFLELLLNVRQLPDGDEYQDDRVIATLRLMNFIRQIGRDEIYIKYVHQLVNMHIQSKNFVEAALTLKLHSDLHEWDLLTFVPPLPDLDLPRQSSFIRKETLCLLILDYLGKGKAWESAVEICQELVIQHMEVTFNYQRLAEVLRHQAMLLERIVTEPRHYPDYFRVGFYGAFPAALRNKQFIYRGYEWEKYDAFCSRIIQKHPGASLLRSLEEPSDAVKFGGQQFIQCTAVMAEPDRSNAIFTNPDVPEAVKTYYEHSAVNIFSFSRQYTRDHLIGTVQSEDVWNEKTYLTTEELFPTVLRRSEIIDVQNVEISPVENALLAVQQQSKELSLLELKFSAFAKLDVPAPTLALSGALDKILDLQPDAGLSIYRQTFFTTEYRIRNPDQEPFIQKLRDAIDDLTLITARCIGLHGMLCPEEMLDYHGTLENFFRKNFHDEIQRLPVDIDLYEYARSPHSPTNTRRSGRDRGATTASISSSGPRPFALGQAPPSLYAASALSQAYSETSTVQHRIPVHSQTPLQRNVAYLTRHGLSGMSNSVTNDTYGDSPMHTPVNLVGATSRASESPSASDPALIVGKGTSQFTYPGSMLSRNTSTATNSISGRLSRFGSLLRRQDRDR